MSGALFEMDLLGNAELARRLRGLTAFQLADVAFDVGQLLESSTRERIATEKTSPGGEAWAPWSEAYDETRDHGRHSLLVGEGDLRDSIQNYTSGFEAVVGTNLVYGAIHHFGGAEVGINIPARPYLGLSAEDEREIRALVFGDIEEAMQ